MSGWREIYVVAALIERDGTILLDRRAADSSMGGLWEFPGGKREPGESDATALRRELMEELGVEATVGERIADVEREDEALRLTLVLYEVQITGEPAAIDVEAIAWFDPENIDPATMPPADQPLLQVVRRRRNSDAHANAHAS